MITTNQKYMPGHSERNTVIQKFGDLLNQEEPKLNLEVFKWLLASTGRLYFYKTQIESSVSHLFLQV